jgi:AraC-like DNA-binding protein
LRSYDFEPLGDSFSFDVSFWRLPHLSISEIASTAMRMSRTRGLTSDRAKDLTLVISRGGELTVSQRDKEATLKGVGAVLMSRADHLSMEHRHSRQIFLSLRSADLSPLVPNLDATLMSPIRCDDAAMRMLVRYLELLTQGAAANAELGMLAEAHVHDLIALALGATGDAAEIAGGRGVRAARLRAIKADIAENLRSGGVSASALAKRHGVTPRYIHKLFEREGVTLSRFVRDQRLAHVRRMLVDPRHADLTIGAIAFQAGFGDLSTFNREFRRQFGATPTDVRFGARG